MSDTFGKSAALTKAWINIKYSAPNVEQIAAVKAQAIEVIKACKSDRDAIYAEIDRFGPTSFGRSKASQLDMLDLWQVKAEAVFDNCDKLVPALAA
jgi:hypothetical protein